jgi:glycosyltransferase involved in cell wall biosynthesis
LRILFIETSFGVAGSTVSLYSLLRHLDRERFRPYVIVAREDQAHYLRTQLEPGLEIHVASPVDRLGRIPGVGRLGSSPRPFFRFLRRLVAVGDTIVSTLPHVGRLYRFARQRRVDIVHQKNGFDVSGFLVSRLLGVPMVAYQEGDEYPSLLVRRLAPRVDRYMACSAFTGANLARVGVPADRVTVVYPPIDLTDFSDAGLPPIRRADLGIPDDAPCFGILGALQEWKGQNVFLRAARRVMEAIPDARACVLGAEPGDEDAYTRELRELARELGIADRVVFTGFLRNVPGALALLDVVVHASIRPEPFGRVIAEAMLMGKPVVATDAGGAREIVHDGVTGLLVPPGDEAALAHAIVTLFRDPSLARRLASEGQRDAAARFSADAHVRLVEQVYAQVGRGHPRSATDHGQIRSSPTPGGKRS